jgi:glycosyltransferase involved in cell wall biosynthesis
VDLFLTIVIPAYNESARLGATLDRVLAFTDQFASDFELIVVDDGSTDDTAEIVRSCASKRENVRLLQNPGNRGKGYSVRHGILEARGRVILFSDADLSAPIEEAPKLFAALENGADIAIGSRWIRAELQTQRQSLARQVLGRAFNQFLRMLLRLDFKDTQCGFKAFRRNAAGAIFPLQQIEGWGFDAEILFLARRLGFTVAEVPVRWGHDERTRINPVADGMRMLAEITKIRWNAVTGVYGTPTRARSGVALQRIEQRTNTQSGR